MDLSLPGQVDRYTWRWFCSRVFGLSLESRTWQRLAEKMSGSKDDTDLDEADRALGITRE